VLDYYDDQRIRRIKTMRKGTTKKEATDKLNKIVREIDGGTYLHVDQIPAFKKVAELWVEFKKTKVRASTLSVYEGHTKNHFAEFENIRMDRLNTITVEKYITDRQKEGMNIVTLKKVLVTLGQIFQYAVRHKYMRNNPLTDAERPETPIDQQRTKIQLLQPKEMVKFLGTIEDYKYKTLCTFAVMSGARQGELLGLVWDDILWKDKQVHIQRSFNNGALYPPKTASSNRKIDLGPSMMTELKKWRLACPKTDLNLIFPSQTGTHINRSNLMNRHFNEALKDAELPKIRFHDLRHFKASVMFEQGLNIVYIASQLGHASPKITLSVYAHVINPVNPEAATGYENLIFSADGSKMVAEKKKGATAETVTP